MGECEIVQAPLDTDSSLPHVHKWPKPLPTVGLSAAEENTNFNKLPCVYSPDFDL